MSRRVELLIALLLALTTAIGLLLGGPPERESPLDTRASTFRSAPDGSKALYDVLVRLGIPVERRRTPLFDLGKSGARQAAPAVLVVLDPSQDLLAAELAKVVRFVRAGGALVAAGAGGGITRCVGWGTAHEHRFFPTDSFGVVSPGELDLPPVADFLTPLTGLEARRRVRGGPSEEDDCEELPPPVPDTLHTRRRRGVFSEPRVARR